MRIGRQRLGWWSCAAAAVCFGAATPATKLIIRDAGPLTLAGFLYVGAAIAVLPFQRREHRDTNAPHRRGLLLLTVALGGGVAPVLLLLALDRATAGTVSLLLNLELVATVVVARVFLHEHIGRRTATGICLVVAGGVIVTDWYANPQNPGERIKLTVAILDRDLRAAWDVLTAARDVPASAYQMMTPWAHGFAAKMGGHPVPGLWMTGGTLALFARNAPGVLHADLVACNAWTSGDHAAYKVRCPALVILSANDIMTPHKRGAELAGRIGGSRTVTLDDCGHMIPAEAPDAVLDALISFFAPATAP